MPDWMNETDIAFPNLGIYLENVPKSFPVFGITIALYGVIIGIGVLLAFALISRLAKEEGLDPDDFYESGLFILFFGILGARLYYVAFSWDYYKNDPVSILNIRQGGLAIYGGVLAGILTMIIYCKVRKKNMFHMVDLGLYGALVGQIVGRWGNFTNREVFGGYSDGLFAMRLPIEAVRDRDISADLAAHIVEGTNYIQVHPTFLYESVCNLLLLCLMLLLRRRRAFDGERALWYLGGYGIIRFFIEGIRTDQLKFPGTELAVSQCLGLLLFLLSAVTAVILRVRTGRKNKETISGTE
ncbi:MAG: prolipoprotein diacylglyceryl transferase [Lachnospiraceae bacterium]|nr:prolipoprotein diacylglyceryl transferase [Lachnospiraceae bacterium]